MPFPGMEPQMHLHLYEKWQHYEEWCHKCISISVKSGSTTWSCTTNAATPLLKVAALRGVVPQMQLHLC